MMMVCICFGSALFHPSDAGFALHRIGSNRGLGTEANSPDESRASAQTLMDSALPKPKKEKKAKKGGGKKKKK